MSRAPAPPSGSSTRVWSILSDNELTNEASIFSTTHQGAGKTSMLLHAMLENQADGCAMLEAHEDPEVVRLRLGKALDFEYNEVRETEQDGVGSQPSCSHPGGLRLEGIETGQASRLTHKASRIYICSGNRTRSPVSSSERTRAKPVRSSTLSGPSQNLRRSAPFCLTHSTATSVFPPVLTGY